VQCGKVCEGQAHVVARCRWAARKKKPCEKIEQLEDIASLPVLTVAQVRLSQRGDVHVASVSQEQLLRKDTRCRCSLTHIAG
jgi:hypothetical protein